MSVNSKTPPWGDRGGVSALVMRRSPTKSLRSGVSGRPSDECRYNMKMIGGEYGLEIRSRQRLDTSYKALTNLGVFAVAGTIIGFWYSIGDRAADRYQNAWQVVRDATSWSDPAGRAISGKLTPSRPLRETAASHGCCAHY